MFVEVTHMPDGAVPKIVWIDFMYLSGKEPTGNVWKA